MEIFGIGAPELVFVIIIALIVLGPKDMQKAGRTIGRWLNQLIQSEGWKAFQQTSREIRNLPTNLMREANMELAETEKELRKATDFRYPSSTSSPSRVPPQPAEAENSTQSGSPSIGSPKTSADSEPFTGEGVGPHGTEHSTQREYPSADLDHAQDIGRPGTENGVERKPDVNTKDQDA
jgi:sec-independent protein translocase protein TatB